MSQQNRAKKTAHDRLCGAQEEKEEENGKIVKAKMPSRV